jgi:hypothetical protein
MRIFAIHHAAHYVLPRYMGKHGIANVPILSQNKVISM